MSTLLIRFASACLLLGLGSYAFAHTSAVSTTPKSGSMLEHSPPSIEITFKDPVRITSIVVQHDGKPERKLESSPKTSAATFKIDNPQLEPGLSHVRWIALSQDGHVIKGVIDLTIKAAASK
jgi:methionine-rich copper-binding protein CopC